MPEHQAHLTVSIVSHGHGPMIAQLLEDLSMSSEPAMRIVLTLNVVEDEFFLEPFSDLPITVVRNPKPQGFGSNHNAAFGYCDTPYFAILNPDLRIPQKSLSALIACLDKYGAGAIGPQIVNAAGAVEDNARRFPTRWNLAKRWFWRALTKQTLAPDYDPKHGVQNVDWLAGMLIVFSHQAYATVGGFDEQYFMYAEDIDIAQRLKRAGFNRIWNPAVTCTHDAQRASHHSLRHFYWHCRSLARYFLKYPNS